MFRKKKNTQKTYTFDKTQKIRGFQIFRFFQVPIMGRQRRPTISSPLQGLPERRGECTLCHYSHGGERCYLFLYCLSQNLRKSSMKATLCSGPIFAKIGCDVTHTYKTSFVTVLVNTAASAVFTTIFCVKRVLILGVFRYLMLKKLTNQIKRFLRSKAIILWINQHHLQHHLHHQPYH